MNGHRIHMDPNRYQEDEESGFPEGMDSDYTELARERECKVNSSGRQHPRHAGVEAAEAPDSLSLVPAGDVVSVSYQIHMEVFKD